MVAVDGGFLGSRFVVIVAACLFLCGANSRVLADDPSDLAYLVAYAESGDPAAQFLLARRLENGDGFAEDVALAATWYRRAAEQGHVAAELRMAWLYNIGEGVPEDAGASFMWLEKAANGGHPLAQYRLAWMYINGDHVGKDTEVAKLWFQLAAKQDYPDAQNALGYLYQHTERGQDFYQAAYWYLTAMHNQHVFAFGNMADLMNAAPQKVLMANIKVYAEPSATAAVKTEYVAGDVVCELMRQGQWIAVVDKEKRILGWMHTAAN